LQGPAKAGWVNEAHLDPIEKAIRAALDKGNPEDGVFRNKIYRSAELALTRSLSARVGLDETAVQARFGHLSKVVASIETEFTPATAPAVSVDVLAHARRSEPNFGTPQPSAPASRVEPKQPRFDADNEPDWSRTPSAGHGDSDVSILSYGRIGKQPEASPDEEESKASSGLFGKLVTALVVITILALLVMFGWTAWNSSLFGNGGDDGTGPAKLSRSENSSDVGLKQVGNGNSENENWITVFEPKDALSVQASNGLSAELRGSGDGAYLNLANASKDAQGEAVFEIGSGILDTMRGKKIVFNVQAKTTDGTTTQMATSCSLAGMGECQRVRFRLEGQLSENLIVMQLADTAPEASGTLTISPDLDKTGNPVEITAIQVRVEQ
jgi:hypothetical protein